MDEPVPGTETESDSFISILRPPLSRKPEGNFKGLLAEYKLWVSQNRDRGYSAFLTSIREMPSSEDSSWEIRQLISRMGDTSSVTRQDQDLKWHLILHLAREFEENQLEAESTLSRVKQQKPPLQEALGEGTPLKGLFEDLAESETSPLADEQHIKQVFEAWLGLFGEHISSHQLLVTLDPHVMNYITEVFEDKIGQFSGQEEGQFYSELASSQIPMTLKHLPSLSDDGDAHSDPVTANLCGKTIILLQA